MADDRSSQSGFRDHLREAYERAEWPTLNKEQIAAINALMQEGRQAGGPGSIVPTRGYADPPPAALMVAATHPRAAGLDADEPEANEITVVADDGRAWMIARAGIAWPLDSNPVEVLHS